MDYNVWYKQIVHTLAPYMGISGSATVPYKVITALCMHGDCSVPTWKVKVMGVGGGRGEGLLYIHVYNTIKICRWLTKCSVHWPHQQSPSIDEYVLCLKVDVL